MLAERYPYYIGSRPEQSNVRRVGRQWENDRKNKTKYESKMAHDSPP